MPRRNSFGNNPATGIVPDMNHLGTGIRLLIIIGNGNRIKFTDRTVSFQNSTGIFPGNRRSRFNLGPNQFRIFSATQSPFGDKIIYPPFPLLISGIPILYGTVFHFGIFLYDNLHNSGMQLVLIPLRSGTPFQITDISIILSHNQRSFKLSRIPGIDPEISGQFHRTTHSLRNIHKRTVAENSRIQGRKIIIPVRHHSTQIFPDKIRMMLYSLRKRTKNNPPFRQRILKSRFHRHTVHHGIHSHSRQSHLLIQGNPQLIKRRFQFRVHIIPVLLLLLFRRRIIYNILIIDFRNIQLCPMRHLHCLPMAISLQTKIQ